MLSGLNSTSGANKKSVSVTSRKSETGALYGGEQYQSDDSILEETSLSPCDACPCVCDA